MSSFILWNFLPFLWEAEPQTAVQVQLPCSHFFEAHSYESPMTPQAVCWSLGMQHGTDTVRTASSAKYEGREDAECPGTHCLCKPWALCSHKLLGKLSVGRKKGVTTGFWLFCAEGTWLGVLKISWVLAFESLSSKREMPREEKGPWEFGVRWGVPAAGIHPLLSILPRPHATPQHNIWTQRADV